MLDPGKTDPDLERRLESLLRADPWRITVLQAVSALALPQAHVGAGFVRNAVWDRLHGLDARTELADIDVLYFDPEDLGKEREYRAEAELDRLMPGLPWQVRNQSRMYLVNEDLPYASLEQALANWLETATAVAVRLEPAGGFGIIAPFGLQDLFVPASRATPAGRRRWDDYMARMVAKNWPRRWPKVKVEGLNA